MNQLRPMCLPVLAALCLLFVPGCAWQRPFVQERITNTNGVVTERTIRLSAYAIWPATASLEKQRGSAGKTITLGQSGLDLDSGGTNGVEALRLVRDILGSVVK